MEPQYFNTELIDFGTLPMMVDGKENEFKFEFPVLHGTVEHVRKGCGCTQAFYDNGVVRGTLNLKDALGRTEKDKDGSYQKVKNITVYFQDGKPLKVLEGAKEVYNKDKQQVILYVKGTVVVGQST